MSTSELEVDSWLRALIGDDDVPARKIRPSRYSVTGYVATTKAEKAQDAESALEHDFLTLLEFDDRVERFLAQPFTIRWADKEKRKRRYTPDVIVKYSFLAIQDEPWRRTTIFEVKPRLILTENWAELRPKYRAAIGWARDHSCHFHIVTEREIRTPYLKNVRFLLQYSSRLLNEDINLKAERQHLIRTTLFKLQRTTPRELLVAMSPDRMHQAELLPWVWNLIKARMIGVDLSLPLTMASTIWCVETPNTFKGL